MALRNSPFASGSFVPYGSIFHSSCQSNSNSVPFFAIPLTAACVVGVVVGGVVVCERAREAASCGHMSDI